MGVVIPLHRDDLPVKMSLSVAQFGFSKVTLLKDQALGRGSYGSVCKAKCDSLTCAAKIIHSVLFDLADPGVRTMMNRFEQECQLLAALKHPNIVQYLGTHTDEASGLPVLLMELMDHSLTCFLETMAPHPLPFHMQLNFSLDVASALAYLHSNSILHRDLSSNNILLLGDRRAKVTDFGMSRLEKVTPRMTPATTCPGTLFYMPPEALKERPLHTDKLDVFSFGVVLIQILTGQFPEPSDRFTTLQVPDPKNKKRTIEAQVAIKEVERRQNHISLVQGSPLLQISLACLEDRHEDRPSTSTVCTQLEEMLALDAYKNSVETESRYRTEYKRLQEELEQQKASIEEMRGELETLQRLLEDKQYVIQEKDRIIKAQEIKMSSGFSLRWRRTRNAPVKFKGRGYTAVVGKKAYFYPMVTAEIYQYDCETDCWDILPHPPERVHPDLAGCNIVSINNLFLTFISTTGKLYTYMDRNEGEKWVEKFPSIDSRCFHCSCVSTRDKVVVFSSINLYGHILDLHTLEWTNIELDSIYSYYYRLMFRFVHNDILYQAAGIDFLGANTIFMSCPESEIKDGDIPWKSLSNMPRFYQTPISFNGNILGLGGRTAYKNTGTDPPRIKTIHRYDIESDSWTEFGEMEVARCNCMVAVVGNKMIVVGDEDSEEGTSRTDIATPV